MAIFRSAKHIYVQFIDDVNNKSLGGISDLKLKSKGLKGKIELAKKVGVAAAELAKKLKISEVVFDRGGFKYHGRVKALAEAAREAGLKF
jgi:large subunit ribosomal protein L18